MAKIMLVEDDTNLSEIYRARLEAEGYTVVSAGDGEAALALAVKEKPDLIICDVMMPKISGFEMLDILRGTDGVKNTRVIMMTALSQAEDKARASALGADRYLVKSQVTLEDVVTAVKEILSNPAVPIAGNAQAAPVAPAPVAAPGTAPAAAPTVTPVPVAAAPAIDPDPEPVTPPPSAPAQVQPIATPITVAQPPAEPAPEPQPAPAATPAVTPVTAPTPAPAPPVAPTPTATQDISSSSSDEKATINEQIENFVGQQSPAVAPPAVGVDVMKAATSSLEAPQPATAPKTIEVHDEVTIPGKKVIQPINDLKAKPNFDLLLAKEEAKAIQNGEAQPVVNGQPVAAAAAPSTGYLGSTPSQAGQSNPNNSSSASDPGSMAL